MAELQLHEALVVRPGDHLIVLADGNTTISEAHHLRDLIKTELPQLKDVTVIAGATGMSVLRDEADNG